MSIHIRTLIVIWLASHA